MIGIIGNGSWATALAKMLTDNGHQVHWWMRNESSVSYIQKRWHNPQYLTSVTFKAGTLLPTTDISYLFAQCTTIIICVPSAYLLPILQSLPHNAFKDKHIISAVKGIIPDAYVLLNDYLKDKFDTTNEQYAAITGPCHAEEVAQERLSYLTFSGLDDVLTRQIAREFTTDYISTTVNHDLWGAQYAAVLKNIYAIGAGVAHGLGYGDNFLSVYITNCYREMYHFLQVQFEQVHPSSEVPDFHTSAYLGDLLVTCYSPHSRNRSFGSLIGKGYSVMSATTEMNMVAEGYYAVKGMKKITEELKIKLPITDHIHDILWGGAMPDATFAEIEKLLS